MKKVAATSGQRVNLAILFRGGKALGKEFARRSVSIFFSLPSLDDAHSPTRLSESHLEDTFSTSTRNQENACDANFFSRGNRTFVQPASTACRLRGSARATRTLSAPLSLLPSHSQSPSCAKLIGFVLPTISLYGVIGMKLRLVCAFWQSGQGVLLPARSSPRHSRRSRGRPFGYREHTIRKLLPRAICRLHDVVQVSEGP